DTSFYSHVKEGLQKGRFPPRRGEIVVSRRNAELLEVTLQDEMLLVVEDSSGSPFYLPYQVGGIFETTAREFDENTIFIQHADAQELVYLQDETTEIRIRLESPQQAESIAAAIANRLDNNELNIRTFRDIHSGVMSMIDMLDFFIIFMNLFVVIVAASVITNAILMNVFERIREFGTMRAIGMKKRGVFRIILIEGGAQGLLGSVLGLLVGIPVVLYFSRQGFEMGEAAEAFGMGMSEFRFAFSIRNSMLNAVGGVLIAMGGSLYAAFVGTRLSIMEALRHD
ncbi:MAG: ABC transporter permease, partial [Spirochaeta sp.]